MHPMRAEPPPSAIIAPRVVIADNDPIMRGVLRSLIARLGFELSAAADGEQALRAAEPHACMFILDLDMPGGGLAVCRALRQRSTFADVPIVILTGHHAQGLRSQCLDAGATLYLTKPFNPAELLRALAPHLPLDSRARAEISNVISVDRGLRLQDAAAARLSAGTD